MKKIRWILLSTIFISILLLVTPSHGRSSDIAAFNPDTAAPLPRFAATPTPAGQPQTGSVAESRMITVLGTSGSTVVYYPYFNISWLDRQIYSRAIGVAEQQSLATDGAVYEPHDGRIIDYNVRSETTGVVKLIFSERASSKYPSGAHIATYYVDLTAGLLLDEQEAARAARKPTYAGTLHMKKMTPAPTSAPDTSRYIALTFDDGPSAFTPTLLGVLRANNAKATFCVLGNRIAKNKSTIAQAAAQGCEVIGHSWDHTSLDKLSASQVRAQINNTRAAIENITGVKTSLYRPPYGSANTTVRAVSRDMGMGIVMWSIDTEDWKYRNAARLYNYIMANVKPGSIILCHDIHQSTVEGMKKIIPELVRRGYKLVTVSELLDFNNAVPVSGKLYYNK